MNIIRSALRTTLSWLSWPGLAAAAHPLPEAHFGRGRRSNGLRLVDTGATRTVRHGHRHVHRLTGRVVEPKQVTVRIFTHVPK